MLNFRHFQHRVIYGEVCRRLPFSILPSRLRFLCLASLLLFGEFLEYFTFYRIHELTLLYPLIPKTSLRITSL